MPDIVSGYTPAGSFTRTSGGGGVGSDNELNDILMTLVRRRLEPKRPAPQRFVARSTQTYQPPPQRSEAERHNVKEDPLALLKAQDRYEMSLRTAAKTPIAGFNYMGWTEDPSKLPLRMRAQNSQQAFSPAEEAAAKVKAAQELSWSQKMDQSRARFAQRGY